MAPFSVSKMCEHAPVALGSFEEGINTQLLLLIIVENQGLQRYNLPTKKIIQLHLHSQDRVPERSNDFSKVKQLVCTEPGLGQGLQHSDRCTFLHIAVCDPVCTLSPTGLCLQTSWVHIVRLAPLEIICSKSFTSHVRTEKPADSKCVAHAHRLLGVGTRTRGQVL